MTDHKSDTSTETQSGPDIPPDRLAINPRSPHYGADLLTRGIDSNADGDDDFSTTFTYDANGSLLSSVRESGERTIYTNLDSKIHKLIDPGVYNYYLQR